MKKFKIIDLTAIENGDDISDCTEYVDECNLHQYVSDILESFYELDFHAIQYGNPIIDLMKYITDVHSLSQILEGLNYKICET